MRENGDSTAVTVAENLNGVSKFLPLLVWILTSLESCQIWVFLFFCYRISPGESLFDKTPTPLASAKKILFCSCSTGTIGAQQEANKLNSGAEFNAFCRRIEQYSWLPSLIPGLDVTTEYISSVDHIRGVSKRESLLEEAASALLTGEGHSRNQTVLQTTTSAYIAAFSSSKESTKTDQQVSPSKGADSLTDMPGNQQHHRRPVRNRQKRQHYYEYLPAFPSQSLSQTDLDGFSYFFPEDHTVDIRQDPLSSWPTPSGLTESHAWELCQESVANSSIGRACRTLLSQRIEDVVRMCVRDLQLKDDLSWTNAGVALLENECERRVSDEVNSDIKENQALMEDLLLALKCPSLCSHQGQCVEWGCACFQGFSSYDCSMLSGEWNSVILGVLSLSFFLLLLAKVIRCGLLHYPTSNLNKTVRFAISSTPIWFSWDQPYCSVPACWIYIPHYQPRGNNWIFICCVLCGM